MTPASRDRLDELDGRLFGHVRSYSPSYSAWVNAQLRRKLAGSLELLRLPRRRVASRVD